MVLHPIGIKNIFSITLKLSKLKCHKKIHKCLDTPSDFCEYRHSTEDTFRPCRQHLLNDVQFIIRKSNLMNRLDNVDVYLHGHHKINAIITRIFCLHPSGLYMKLAVTRLPPSSSPHPSTVHTLVDYVFKLFVYLVYGHFSKSIGKYNVVTGYDHPTGFSNLLTSYKGKQRGKLIMIFKKYVH